MPSPDPGVMKCCGPMNQFVDSDKKRLRNLFLLLCLCGSTDDSKPRNRNFFSSTLEVKFQHANILKPVRVFLLFSSSIIAETSNHNKKTKSHHQRFIDRNHQLISHLEFSRNTLSCSKLQSYKKLLVKERSND